jgi:hypothetical protein
MEKKMPSIIKKRVQNKSQKSTRSEPPELPFTVKHYGFNIVSLKDPAPSELYPASGWQKGTHLLLSFLMHLLLFPKSRPGQTTAIINDLLSGLPKSMATQAFMAAEDLMRVGAAGHFVTCSDMRVLRFDTSVQAQAHLEIEDGAKTASMDDVNRYLIDKAHDLVFVI